MCERIRGHACVEIADRSAARSRARPSRSTASGGHTKPVTPSSMISGSPPTFDATTGTSHAIASSAARPKLSCADGSRNRSAIDSHGTSSCCSPTNDDVVGQPVVGDAPLDVGPHRAVADEHEPRAHAAANQAEHLQRHVDALDRPEVRDVHDERVASLRRAQPRAQVRIVPAAILGAIEEVGDDADLVLDAERADRVALQALATRRSRRGTVRSRRRPRARTTDRCRRA